MKTLRQEDSRGEAAVAAFLDEYFYPKITTKFHRKTDKEHQLKGVDVIFDYKEKHCIVDEKAAIHYVNRNLPTFAFEIDYYRRDGQLKTGWFYDDEKVTDYYLLNWIKATKSKNFTSQDITEIEVLLLNRKRLQEALATKGATQEGIKTIAQELRTNNQFGVSHKSYNTPYYFYYTQHLAEKPINMIVKKWFLKELSDYYSVIKK